MILTDKKKTMTTENKILIQMTQKMISAFTKECSQTVLAPCEMTNGD